MQLNLGKTIRELRHRDGRTQDALAEALGVTAQAVSRWESGGSYPDMELIPAIANYFHISIDELFGYHDDREKKIEEIFADGRFGKWHYHIGQLYLTLADYEAARSGTAPNTSPYRKKGFEHLKQYERISQEEEYTYSAPLLSNFIFLYLSM